MRVSPAARLVRTSVIAAAVLPMLAAACSNPLAPQDAPRVNANASAGGSVPWFDGQSKQAAGGSVPWFDAQSKQTAGGSVPWF